MKKKLLVTLLAVSMTSAMITGCLPKPTYNPENDIVDEYDNDFEDEIDELNDSMDELNDELEDMTTSETDSKESEEDTTEDKEDAIEEENTDETDEEEADASEQEEAKEDADKKADTTVSDELSANWADLQFQLEGQVLTLPCDYKDIEALGYSVDLSDYGYENGYILNPNDKTYSTIDLENAEGAEITVGFINTGDEAKDILECQIWSIGSRTTYVDAVPNLVFPGGITWGATLEEVEAAYGTLDEEDIYTSDLGYKSYSYEDFEDNDKYLDVEIYTNDPDGKYEGVTGLEIKYY